MYMCTRTCTQNTAKQCEHKTSHYLQSEHMRHWKLEPDILGDARWSEVKSVQGKQATQCVKNISALQQVLPWQRLCFSQIFIFIRFYAGSCLTTHTDTHTHAHTRTHTHRHTHTHTDTHCTWATVQQLYWFMRAVTTNSTQPLVQCDHQEYALFHNWLQPTFLSNKTRQSYITLHPRCALPSSPSHW